MDRRADAGRGAAPHGSDNILRFPERGGHAVGDGKHGRVRAVGALSPAGVFRRKGAGSAYWGWIGEGAQGRSAEAEEEKRNETRALGELCYIMHYGAY